jgi:hypothetical protein
VVAALGTGYLAVRSGRQTSTSTSTSQGASTSTNMATSSAITIQPPAPAGGAMAMKLVLHTPQYVEGIIHQSLILPNATALGPSYGILGVMVEGPVNLTATNESPWNVLIYLSNQSASSFVNGTTTDLDVLKNGGVVVGEDGVPPGMPLNSTAAAEADLAPQVICVGKGMNPTPADSSCTTQSYTGQSYIVTQNGLSIVVNPEGPALTWVDDRNRMGMSIDGETQSIQQLLDLANTMTEQLQS